jgi:hypothetical protein
VSEYTIRYFCSRLSEKKPEETASTRGEPCSRQRAETVRNGKTCGHCDIVGDTDRNASLCFRVDERRSLDELPHSEPRNFYGWS